MEVGHKFSRKKMRGWPTLVGINVERRTDTLQTSLGPGSTEGRIVVETCINF